MMVNALRQADVRPYTPRVQTSHSPEHLEKEQGPHSPHALGLEAATLFNANEPITSTIYCCSGSNFYVLLTE